MRLKPKSTVHNPRALLYKRFTDLETSIANNRIVLYYTEDGKYWQFSAGMVKFIEYTGDTDTIPSERKIPAGGSTFEVMLAFANGYFVYRILNGKGEWTLVQNLSDISEAFVGIDFNFPEGTTELNEKKSLSGFILPEELPDAITYTADENITGFTVTITDDMGQSVRYYARTYGVLDTPDRFSYGYETNTILIEGQISRAYPIQVFVNNGSVYFADESIEAGEDNYARVECNANNEYYSPFVINLVGAEPYYQGQFGYIVYKRDCDLYLSNAVDDVFVYVDFTRNVVDLEWRGMHNGSSIVVPARLVAKFVDYNFNIDRTVELDFYSEGVGFYIDQNPNIEYTIEESDHEYNEDLRYLFYGMYKGVQYSGEVLTKALVNGVYIVKSPAGENTWQFTAQDNQHAGAKAIMAEWLQ